MALRGSLYGSLIYGATIIITLIIGLCAVVLLPNLRDTHGSFDAAVPALVVHVLPTGLIGFAVAGMLALLMSSSDSYLLISIQTITNDILRTLRPNMTDKQELTISRLAVPVLGFGAMAIALYIKSAYAALMFAWTFYAASVGIPAFAALCWRKASTYSIITSVLLGFGVSCVWHAAGSPLSLAPSIAGSIACGISLVLVSHFTYREGEGVFLEP